MSLTAAAFTNDLVYVKLEVFDVGYFVIFGREARAICVEM